MWHDGNCDLKIRLEAKLTQDGDAWIASCPPPELYTQSDTKDSALAHLREAILASFESCLERDVLSQALGDAGFQKIPTQETHRDKVIPEPDPAPDRSGSDYSSLHCRNPGIDSCALLIEALCEFHGCVERYAIGAQGAIVSLGVL